MRVDQNLKPDAVTLTKTLAAHLAAARPADLTPAARHAARRGVLDWIGCALAGSTHPTIAKLLAVLKEAGGRPQARVIGQSLRLGLLDAPLANGQIGHVLSRLPAPARQQIGVITRAAFTSGLDHILLVAAVIALVSGAVTLFAIRQKDFAQQQGGAAPPGG